MKWQVSEEVAYGLKGALNPAALRTDRPGALVLINQSEPNERSLDPQQGHTVVGGGDHLLKGLRGCFEQAIQSRIVTLSTSVREFVTLAACKEHLIRRTV